MSILDQMLAKNGLTRASFQRNSKMGKLFFRNGIPETPELKRIINLPRRRWQDDPDLEAFADAITEAYRLPGGTMRLRLVQAVALSELHDFDGLFAPIRVAGGKTLISYLAGVVCESKSTLVLVPASLRQKTYAAFAELSKHWLAPTSLTVESYTMVSRETGEAMLNRIAPDLIVADEAHRLKNTRAGVTRKIARYLKANPSTRFCAMSGTMTIRSLREYAHLLRWAIGEKLQPLPRMWGELADWADCLDVKVQDGKRMPPGALLQLCSDSELVEANGVDPTSRARRAYRRRLVETPGIVATEENELGTSLQIVALDATEAVGDDVAEAYRRVRETWELPDGHDLCEAIEVWRHLREVALGFWYRWDPEPPRDWMAARKEWSAFVRETLKTNRSGLDTELQVARACARKELDGAAYQAWVAIRDTFKPNTVAEWINDSALEVVGRWLSDNDGIAWVEHVHFGERLSERTGLPYFRAQGRDRNGNYLEHARGPVIASIASCREGMNLQHAWHRNLIVSTPANGGRWEQLLGRTHRDGQLADEVVAAVLQTSYAHWQAFQQAIADARYIQDSMGQPQKLLYADRAMPNENEVYARGLYDPLWAPTSGEP
jgi:hypothetical protein